MSPQETGCALTEELLRKAPKVLIHDHLDGGLRPDTVVELAGQQGVELPERDPDRLRSWFFDGKNKQSLAAYLKGFQLTTGVMQSEQALYRAAYEMMEDLSRDGVVYVETRFSPLFHTRGGLTHDQVVESVLRGLRDGSRVFGVAWGLVVCAMRNMPPASSMEMARLAVRYRNQGVVGFDLAGDELGYPPKDHLEAFHYIQRNNFYITVHAGEAFGKESIWQAVQYCGTHRIGHGLHLKDDIMSTKHRRIMEMGTLAQYVLDRRIPLELCLSSNLHTGAVPDLRYHPFPLFFHNGFRVTLNTDNRLMSGTTLTNELLAACRSYGLTLRDVEKLTINAMKSSFIDFHTRLRLIYDTIKPGFARLAKSGGPSRQSQEKKGETA
ncbi:MAG: adenosine deaminase [Spirochaetota bacterium]